MQEIQFYLVDAFSDKNFGGNAAAVCPLSEWLADDVLLKMAQQHNQSETAFFVRTDEGYELRWFTTLAEINLCGHATLAAAHVIFEYLDHPSATILFSTRFVGELRVTRNGDWLTLDFPAWSTSPWKTRRRICWPDWGLSLPSRCGKGAIIWWCWRIASRLKRCDRIWRGCERLAK